jgi:YesN/AraC family two-component response regulator
MELKLFKIAASILSPFLPSVAANIYKKKKIRFSKKDKQQKNVLPTYDFSEKYIEKLRRLMEYEKLYINADISLQTLADKMAISPHKLSHLLNEKFNRSFFNFINNYRIEEAKRILQSSRGSEQKISTVAFAVGFNTMAAFYNAFKKHTGTIPTRYKEEARRS